jgi:beta-lactam-binding protein with PASTA domain
VTRAGLALRGVRPIGALLLLAWVAVACVRPPSSQLVVPNLVGLGRADAQAVLTKEGLQYRVVVQPLRVRTCPSIGGLVVGQSPRGGTPALTWTVVTIVAFAKVTHASIGTTCVPPP